MEIFEHDNLYERVTIEIPFDKDTIDKLRTLNINGYVIENVKMDFAGEGVVIQMEKLVREDE